MKSIFWKVVIRFLGCQRNDFTKAIKIGKEIYILSIKKFVSADKELQKWKDALENPRTPD